MFHATHGPAHGDCRVKRRQQSYRKQGHRTRLLEQVGTKAKFVKPKFVKREACAAHVQWSVILLCSFLGVLHPATAAAVCKLPDVMAM